MSTAKGGFCFHTPATHSAATQASQHGGNQILHTRNVDQDREQLSGKQNQNGSRAPLDVGARPCTSSTETKLEHKSRSSEGLKILKLEQIVERRHIAGGSATRPKATGRTKSSPEPPETHRPGRRIVTP
jgi:hypothetical protein